MINLRYLRLENNLSQKELSDKVGVKQNTISQIESGARNPSLSVAQKLSEVLGCTVDELLKEKEGKSCSYPKIYLICRT